MGRAINRPSLVRPCANSSKCSPLIHSHPHRFRLFDIFSTCRISIFRYDEKTLRQKQGKLAMPTKTSFSRSAIAGIVVLISAQCGGASAQQIQDEAAIRSAIEATISPRLITMVGASGEIEVGTIDSRLRLEACPNIDVELPPTNAATMTAKVSCQDPS